MPNVTGLHKSGRGRPTLSQVNEYKEMVENSPKLFDTTPFTIDKKSKIILPDTIPQECTSMEDWLKWCYQFLLLNKQFLNIVEIYEAGISAPYSLVDTLAQNDVNINTLIENRIINLTLQNKIRSVFAAQLLAEKYGWDTDNTKEVQFNDAEIKFNFA